MSCKPAWRANQYRACREVRLLTLVSSYYKERITMSDIAIDVKDVTKIYRLYDKPVDRLKEALGLSKQKKYREHYALKNINFTVNKGDCIGIIGTNGAGKSTILKIITGVLSPTAGSIEINGRISALLELGAGFNMEYTGIENVYLNGSMIGFSHEEIDEKLEDILAFADIGDFVYQPVKTYSSGMFVRLAFAVAINIDPEILIVDEALSVGDVFFQLKCFKKFEEFKKNGKTILFVSHDLSSIQKYCDRAILLNKGEKMAEGTPKEIIDLYKKVLVGKEDSAQTNNVSGSADRTDASSGETASGQNVPVSNQGSSASGQYATGSSQDSSASGQNVTGSDQNISDYGHETSGTGQKAPVTLYKTSPAFAINPDFQEYGDKEVEITDFAILDEDGDCAGTIMKGSEFTVLIRIRANKPVKNPIAAFTILDLRGTDLTGTNTWYEKNDIGEMNAGEERVIRFRQQMNLQGGEYVLSLGCTRFEIDRFDVYHRLYDILNLTVVSAKNTVGFFDMNSTVTVSAN